ncbi:MAG: SDR family oxidoreductase [Lachnospiraceae bacterium]|nr:SDR family oxidoreductase [Lachnospiraceae bacterium]
MIEYRQGNYVQDKVIIVTGASSGFGEATARTAAAMGAKVILAARREEKLQQIVKEIKEAGGTAEYIVTDVGIQEQAEAMARFAVDTYGCIDVLVNDAGTMPQAFFADHKLAMKDWEQCLNTSIYGTLYCTCAVYDQMMAQGRGHIINVSSILGDFAVNGNGVYNVSKAGVRYLAESLRTETRGIIKTTVIRPTSVPSTELGKTIVNVNESMAGMYEKLFAAMMKNPYTTPGMNDRNSIQYDAPVAQDIVDNIIYAINQPWGVDISDITVRASGENMYL